jgi:toxin ParE1/3/4
MKVRFTATAELEISEILSFIATDNPPAAVRVASQVDHTISLIAKFPRIGRTKHRGLVRMLPVRHYPQYLLFYVIEDEEIVILNLRHARRRPLDEEAD